MKYISLIVLLIILGCKPTRVTVQKPVIFSKKHIENNFQIKEKIELLPHQKLQIVNDEWGQKYIKLVPGNMTVLKYVFTKKPTDKTLMDAGYNQIIWFQLGDKIKNSTFKSADLQKHPLYVQKTGFRNRQFITVKKGTISIKIMNDNKVSVSIQIAPEYSSILKKNMHQTMTLN